MRDVYDGLQDLLAHTARQIADGLEEEYARMLDVMYFPQLVSPYRLSESLIKGILGHCAYSRRWGTNFHARGMGSSILNKRERLFQEF